MKISKEVSIVWAKDLREMRNGEEGKGIIVGYKIQQETPRFWKLFRFKHWIIVINEYMAAFQILIRKLLGGRKLPPEFSLCHLIRVVWNKESSQVTSETESLLITNQDACSLCSYILKDIWMKYLSSLKKYVHKYMYFKSN